MKWIILRLVLLSTGSGSLSACSCGTIDSTEQHILTQYNWYDAVFIGRVSSSDRTTARFEILRRYKGMEGRTHVTSRYFDSCSTVYSPGYYLIYGNMEGEYLNTSYCSLNRRLEAELIPPPDPYSFLYLDPKWGNEEGRTFHPQITVLEQLVYSPERLPSWLAVLISVLTLGAVGTGIALMFHHP